MKMESFDNSIFDKYKIFVICGSGGVGKTTTSAALAIKAAIYGKKAIVITIDPAKRLATSLGLDTISNTPLDLTKSLNLETSHLGQFFAVTPDTAKTFEQFVRSVGSGKSDSVERILKTSIYKIFTQDFSGSHEYMAMEKLHSLARDGHYDCIILDTPPSVNTKSFLEAPNNLSQFFDDSNVKWLIEPLLNKSSKLLSSGVQKLVEILEKLTGKGFIGDLLEFSSSMFELKTQFKKNLDLVETLLHDKQTAFYMVSTPERFSIEETMTFVDLLKDRKFRFEGFIFNKLLSLYLGDEAQTLKTQNLKEVSFEMGLAQKKLLTEEHTYEVVKDYHNTFIGIAEQTEDVHSIDALKKLTMDFRHILLSLCIFFTLGAQAAPQKTITTSDSNETTFNNLTASSDSVRFDFPFLFSELSFSPKPLIQDGQHELQVFLKEASDLKERVNQFAQQTLSAASTISNHNDLLEALSQFETKYQTPGFELKFPQEHQALARLIYAYTTIQKAQIYIQKKKYTEANLLLRKALENAHWLKLSQTKTHQFSANTLTAWSHFLYLQSLAFLGRHNEVVAHEKTLSRYKNLLSIEHYEYAQYLTALSLRELNEIKQAHRRLNTAMTTLRNAHSTQALIILGHIYREESIYKIRLCEKQNPLLEEVDEYVFLKFLHHYTKCITPTVLLLCEQSPLIARANNTDKINKLPSAGDLIEVAQSYPGQQIKHSLRAPSGDKKRAKMSAKQKQFFESELGSLIETKVKDLKDTLAAQCALQKK